MTFITVLIAFVSLLLMVVILIQNPKGGGVDATFGGAQANQLFGAAKSADFIEKATIVLAALVFVLCIVAAVLAGGGAAAGGGEQLLSQLFHFYSPYLFKTAKNILKQLIYVRIKGIMSGVNNIFPQYLFFRRFFLIYNGQNFTEG